MHVHTPARFAVLDRCPGVSVRCQPRPGGFLELVHRAANLFASLGLSSGAQAMTPDVYLCSN